MYNFVEKHKYAVPKGKLVCKGVLIGKSATAGSVAAAIRAGADGILKEDEEGAEGE